MGLVIYILVLYWLISSYRQLHGRDERSLVFQKKVDERAKKSKLLPSKESFGRVLLIGISAALILIVAYVIKAAHLIGRG